MTSFLEKLKKGMNIEETFEEEEESTSDLAPEETREEEVLEEKVTISEREIEPTKKEKTKKTQIKFSQDHKKKKEKVKEEKELPKIEMKKIEIQEKMPEEEVEERIIEEDEKDLPREIEEEKKWSSLSKAEEGQLAIDVYQTENDLVIQSAIAGVKPENLDISIEKDIVAIKGNREKPFKENSDYLTQECFWGAFSREIIMPVETDPQRAIAEMKNGVLTIRIPKILREKKRKIDVKG